MKGGGKYVRVWVYGANAAYLDNVDNQGRVINEALAAYSQIQSGSIYIPSVTLPSNTPQPTTDITTTYSRGGLTVIEPVNMTNVELTCGNGHLLNATTGKCVGKMCEFAK